MLPSFVKILIFLGKHMLHTLMVSENNNIDTIQIMPINV